MCTQCVSMCVLRLYQNVCLCCRIINQKVHTQKDVKDCFLKEQAIKRVVPQHTHLYINTHKCTLFWIWISGSLGLRQEDTLDERRIHFKPLCTHRFTHSYSLRRNFLINMPTSMFSGAEENPELRIKPGCTTMHPCTHCYTIQ